MTTDTFQPTPVICEPIRAGGKPMPATCQKRRGTRARRAGACVWDTSIRSPGEFSARGRTWSSQRPRDCATSETSRGARSVERTQPGGPLRQTSAALAPGHIFRRSLCGRV